MKEQKSNLSEMKISHPVKDTYFVKLFVKIHEQSQFFTNTTILPMKQRNIEFQACYCLKSIFLMLKLSKILNFNWSD